MRTADRAMSAGASPQVRRILIAKGLRAFGDGFVSVLLPLYLLELGYAPLQVGIIATATLLGSGLLTLMVGMRAHRFAYRTLLLGATALMSFQVTATSNRASRASLRTNEVRTDTTGWSPRRICTLSGSLLSA